MDEQGGNNTFHRFYREHGLHVPRIFMMENIIAPGMFLFNSKLPCGEFVEKLYSMLARFRGKEFFEDICMVCLDIH